jgi:Zn finger protein HypA/HybF involved in hydrogenase expression
MRIHVEPPPEARCDHCSNELQLKKVIESVLDLDEQILVCPKCGREQTRIVSRNHYQPHLKIR